MALRLHVPTHHTEAQERLAVARDERRNNRMEWSLVRRVGIKFALLQIEKRAAILEREAESFGTNPRAEPKVKALYE